MTSEDAGRPIGHAQPLGASAAPETGAGQLTPQGYPTIWGLDPIRLHDHFWASRGVFVVRPGEQTDLPDAAELYLLTDASTFVVFRLAPLLETLSWVNPSVLFLRLTAPRSEGYREVVVTDRQGRFQRFRRLYGFSGGSGAPARMALTRDRVVAAVWQSAHEPRQAWHNLRRQARAASVEYHAVRGRAYHRESDAQMAELTEDILRRWSRPSATVPGIRRVSPNVWAAKDATIGEGVRFIDSVWVGAGRQIERGTTVLGPAILWDDPSRRPPAVPVAWSELEPTDSLRRPPPPRPASAARRGPRGKRLFDVAFALLVLAATLPFYPLIMLAIWLEDGWPVFFAHRRQTLGGREFRCLKFRSMRRNAEEMKRKLARENRADGPQFYFVHDPRLTRVGAFLRKTHVDELPQFINVLLGDMSVVGPRPSPSEENQFNPAWREARLSVRAGITGLWQVRRTRRPGLDFQEWIKYDLEYVNNAGWLMDLGIIYRTVRNILRGSAA